MNKKYKQLRQKAEQLLKQKGIEKPEQFYDDIDRLVEELNIHQIELEMQNQELQEANLKLQENTKKLANEQKRYKELYMNAPVAYFTLNRTGNIIDINKAAAQMLNIPIHQFKYTSIFPYLEENSKKDFSMFFKEIVNTKKTEYGDITFIDSTGRKIFATLSALVYFDSQINEELVRCTVIDLSKISHFESLVAELNNANDELNATNEEFQLANEELNVANDELRDTNLLLENERKQFLSILDSIPENIYVEDFDTHEILFANKNLNKTIGRDITGEICYKAIMKKTNICEFCPIDNIKNTNKPHFWEHYNPILDKHFFVMDRKIKWVGQKEVHFQMAIDITDHKKAEIQKSYLSAIIENTENICVIKDLDQRVIATNESFAKAAGKKSVNELIGKTDAEIFNISSQKEPIKSYMADDRLAQTLKKGEKIVREEEVIYPDNTIKTVLTSKFPVFDNNNNLIATANISTDITERKNAEQENKKLSAVIEQSPATVVITDLEAKIEYVNPAFTKLSGYTKEEATGKNPRILQSGKTKPEVFKQLWDTITVGKTWQGLFINKTKNGDEYIEHSTIAPIFDEQNQTISYVAIKEDITEKVKFQNQIKESEEKLRVVINTISDLIFYKNSEGVYQECNNRFELFTGKKRKDLVGLTDFDLFPKKVADFFREKDKEVMNIGKPESNEEWVTFSDGHKELLDTVKAPYFNADGEIIGIVGISRNITDRKKAEQALKASEEKFKTLFEANLDSLAVFQFDENGKPSHFIDCNQSAADIIGFTKEEILQSSPVEVEIIEDFKSLGKRVDELKTKGSAHFETKLRHKQGHTVFVEVIATMINYNNQPAIMNITRDITERKKAEQALKESEDRFKKLSAFTFEGIVIHNNGIVIDCNHSAVRLIGYQRDEIIGMNLFKVIHPDCHAKVKEMMAKNLAKPYQIVIIRKDGSTFDAETEAQNIQYSGEYFRVACVRDITERKKQERTIEKQTIKLKEAIATKDKFFNIIAHDLKSPFNSILGFSDLLMKNIEKYDKDKIKRFVTTINEAGNNTFKLLENLLQWARSQQNKIPFNPEEHKLHELANETYTLVNHAANEKEITISLDIPNEISIVADAEMLKTIIRNLVSNAIKYTPENGKITISAQQNHNEIIIKITDTGTGMDEQTKNHYLR
ncbi:MAG: PAS domain S-box protein [Bacteroidales bacterium]|nr:PAS domain S-box protein [Bacteroidales bacterium]